MTELLESLHGVGAHEQVTVLAERTAAHVAVNNPVAVTELHEKLREVGALQQAMALAERLPAAGLFDQFIEIGDYKQRFRFGRKPGNSAADPWEWEDLE